MINRLRGIRSHHLSILRGLIRLPKTMSHFRKYPPVFIIGAPRSGTTLMLQVLTSQPMTSQCFEPHKIWVKVLGDNEDDAYKNNLRFLEKVKLIDKFSDMLSPDRPKLICKNPRDSLRVGLLFQLFPNARFVHIVRNPLDVIASIVNIWQGTGYRTDKENDWIHVRIPGYKKLLQYPPHIKAAHIWKACVKNIIDAFTAIPENNQLTVMYEDLVENPKNQSIKVIRFALDTLDEVSLGSVLPNISSKVGKPQQNSSLFTNTWIASEIPEDAGSGTTSISNRVHKWKEQLTDEMLEDCLPIISEVRAGLGYGNDFEN